MINNRRSNYRWYILALAATSGFFAMSIPRHCMPVLFKEISEDLSLNLVEIGAVWGMVALAGVFISLISGLLADRFGVKRTMIFVCLLSGILGGLRGVSVNFITLAATMLMFGFFSWPITNIAHKTAGVWFHQHRLGLANGILVASITLGAVAGSMLSATLLSPLLGGWRNVMFLYAIVPIVLSILWFTTGREPGGMESSTGTIDMVPFRQALVRVVRNKALWIIAFVRFGQMGSLQGMLGYLPLYLREIGWIPVSADSTIAIHAGITAIMAIPITLLADKFGLRKKLLVPALLISGISLGFLYLAEGTTIWVLIIITAICQSAMVPIILTMVVETKDVGPQYAGTATGLTYSVGNIGGFISPPLGNSLADVHPGLPFVFWGALSVITLIGFAFLKDTKQSDDDSAFDSEALNREYIPTNAKG